MLVNSVASLIILVIEHRQRRLIHWEQHSDAVTCVVATVIAVVVSWHVRADQYVQ